MSKSKIPRWVSRTSSCDDMIDTTRMETAQSQSSMIPPLKQHQQKKRLKKKSQRSKIPVLQPPPVKVRVRSQVEPKPRPNQGTAKLPPKRGKGNAAHPPVTSTITSNRRIQNAQKSKRAAILPRSIVKKRSSIEANRPARRTLLRSKTYFLRPAYSDGDCGDHSKSSENTLIESVILTSSDNPETSPRPPLCIVSPRIKKLSPPSPPSVPLFDEPGELLESDEDQVLRFHCCDGKMAYISAELINRHSLFLREQQQEPPFRYSRPIFLHGISSTTMLRILLWLEEQPQGQQIDSFLSSCQLPQLVELILAANYLGVATLAQLANDYVAELMAQRSSEEQSIMQGIGKSLDQVRGTLTKHRKLLAKITGKSRANANAKAKSKAKSKAKTKSKLLKP